MIADDDQNRWSDRQDVLVEDSLEECSTMNGNKNGVAPQIRNWIKNVCWHTATATHLILLQDTLDMVYQITKLGKKSPKREQNSTEIKQNFWDKWNVTIMNMIWTQQLWKSSSQQGGLFELHLWFNSEELWKFNEIVWMSTRQCLWLWYEGKNNWWAD